MLLTFENNIMEKQFVIKHPSQLNSLSTLPFVRRTGLGKIVFDESFQHPDKGRLEQNINKEYFACGCSQGAKALLIGLLLFIVIGSVGHYSFNWSVMKTIITIFGGTIASAVLGKVIGLISANMRLKRIVRETQSIWKIQGKESKIIGCG